MTTLIAILWYLQLLAPNTMYTIDQVNAIAAQNQTAVSAVQTDAAQTNAALQQFQTDMNNDYKKIIENWEDDPQPILK